MALNDEIRIDASSSKRSQTTGHLLVVMPKLNVGSCLEVEKSLGDQEKIEKEKKQLKKFDKCVDIRNIFVDESEVPPLI
jgi:hypothetical protein